MAQSHQEQQATAECHLLEVNQSAARRQAACGSYRSSEQSIPPSR